MVLLRLSKYVFLVFLLFAQICFGQKESSTHNIEKLSTSFNAYLDSLHPQKVYLQLDKQKYFAPERIWFKVFLLDGRSHLNDTLSEHVYVELIDPYKRVVQFLRIRAEENRGGGNFLLADTVPAGIYQLRAYTSWMQNFGAYYYFTWNIRVENNLHSYFITEEQAKENRKEIKREAKKSKDIEVGFFPEGGNLLLNKVNVVGFKAMNSHGKGVEIEGRLVDKDKNLICTFRSTHNGMGAFRFIPEKDKDYIAHVGFENGETKKIKLPVAFSNSAGLSIDESESNFIITIKSNKKLSADRPANEYSLIGQVSGKIYHRSSSNLIDRDTLVVVEKSKFPQGIVHFALFNNRQQAVSERLAFNNRGDFIDFTIEASVNPDTLHITINENKLSEKPTPFNGGISVLQSNDQLSAISEENILSHLLITSELPGYIESPAYYFSSSDPEVRQHADLLMLTHGWTRFSWHDIIEDEFPPIKYLPEQGIRIEGKITRDILDIPMKDASVKMYIRDRYNDEFLTYSGEGGSFEFDNLNYDDTIDVKIVARKPGGGKGVLIHLDETEPAKIDFRGDQYLTTKSQLNKKYYRRVQKEIADAEFERREKELDSVFSQSIHGRPDFVLWADEIPPGCSDLYEALKGRVAGVDIIGKQIVIRGVNSFYASQDPLLVVDNVITDISFLGSIPIHDVERVEILKGPSSAIYGSRGGNGVIAVYTKRGEFMKKGEISFSMLGYHVQEKFYSPLAEQIGAREETGQLPITIYWNSQLLLGAGQTKISIPNESNELFKIVVIEGIDSRGKPGYAYSVFK